MARSMTVVALVGLVCGLTVGQNADALDSPACVATRLPSPPGDRPTYRMVVRADRDLVDISGSLSVAFAPSVPTDRIVFRLWPNSPAFTGATRLTVGPVTSAGGTLATSRSDPMTLVVRRPLRAGERVVLAMTWRLRLSTTAGQRLRGGHPTRLVSFFPPLAWDGSGWATDAPVRRLGEWPTSPVADFDVQVVAPRGVDVLAAGREVRPGRWRAQAVRDFALAIGSFKVVRTVVRVPDPIAVVVGMERRSFTPIGPFVEETRRSLRFYAQRYGAYSWPTYTLVAASDLTFPDGFAYSTIGFVGDSSLVLVPHETAHQWFQALVGNNQSRDPWVSERLATWAQTGPERSLGALLATAIPPDVRNRLGQPVRFFDRLGFEKLRLGVYVQTVQALASLGDPATVDCALRSFVARNAYRVATPRDLLDALDDFFPDAETKLRAHGARF